MSAIPPKADIRRRDQDVCFGPSADIQLACLFRRFGEPSATEKDRQNDVKGNRRPQ
jgi:hypothetical protein